MCPETFIVSITSPKQNCSSRCTLAYKNSRCFRDQEKLYRNTPEFKQREKERTSTPEYKQRLKERTSTPEYKQRLKERLQKRFCKLVET